MTVARALLLLLVLVASSCSPVDAEESASDRSEPAQTETFTGEQGIELQLVPLLPSYSAGGRVELALLVDDSINLQSEVLKGIGSYLERWEENRWERLFVLTGAFDSREPSFWPIDDPNRGIVSLAWAGDVEEVVVLPPVGPGRYRIVKKMILTLDEVNEPVLVGAEFEVDVQS